MLVSDGPVTFASRSESVSSCILVLLDLVFLWYTGGEGCPSDLVIKSGGPITFVLRSEVSSLV